jgi:hypothetical protein
VENEREKIRELLRQQLKEDGELLSCKNKENLVDKDNDINSDLHIIDLQPSVHPQRFDASLISQSANHLTS